MDNNETASHLPGQLDLLNAYVYQQYECEHPVVGYLNYRPLCVKCGLRILRPKFNAVTGIPNCHKNKSQAATST